jgi:hypothetical protein
MPKAYEHIRDKFLGMGDSKKDAEKRAAMIWNGKIRKPGEAAMGPNWEARNEALQRKKGGTR